VLDRERLAKVLALTTSDNDAEALAAIRRANEIIKGENLGWLDVIAQQHYLDISAAINKGPFATTDAPIEDWGPGIRRKAPWDR
jgi:hypothetical protein